MLRLELVGYGMFIGPTARQPTGQLRLTHSCNEPRVVQVHMSSERPRWGFRLIHVRALRDMAIRITSGKEQRFLSQDDLPSAHSSLVALA